MPDEFDAPLWDVPGWDWDRDDNAWLSSNSGIYDGETSIFFIHGGRIRHQAHLPQGWHPVDEFCQMVHDRAEGLDDPRVVHLSDTGGGDAGLWVEGTRPPNDDDLARLHLARERQRRRDEIDARLLRERRPDLFEPSPGAAISRARGEANAWADGEARVRLSDLEGQT